MARCLFAVLWIVAGLSCAPSPQGNGASASQELSMAASPGESTISLEPLTIRFAIPETLRRGLEEPGEPGTGQVIRLSVEGIQPPVEDVGIRVFVNLPDATRVPSSADDPHYAASLAFYPEPGSTAASDRAAFLIDLTHVLRRLEPEERLVSGEVAVTLAATPLREGESLEGVAIPFEKLRLTAISSR